MIRLTEKRPKKRVPKPPRYPVEATRAERLAAEQAVIDLLTVAGFVRIGMSDGRLMHTEHGKPIQMNPRKRYENRDHVRVTVGPISIFIYTVDEDGDALPIARHKTLELNAIKATLAKL